MKSRNLFRILFLLAIFCAVIPAHSQSPHLMSYQAVVRNISNEPIVNSVVTIAFTIRQGTAVGTEVYSESHSVNTNQFGLVNLMIGNGVTSDDLSQIDWSLGPYFLKVDVNGSETGINQIVSVPYALFAARAGNSWSRLNDTIYYMAGNVGIGTSDPRSTLSVEGTTPNDSAIFEVKNNLGVTVFAVYNEGVRVLIDQDYLGKGPKGGFAIGGFDRTKGIVNEFMLITPDSVRIYVANPIEKGPKGGFAIGGFDRTKGITEDFFTVSGKSATDIYYPSEPIMLWYPKKEAFLVGRVLIESPDSVGFNSLATGFESKAAGNWSHALGYQTIARGEYSTAIGRNAEANAVSSVAIGNQARAINEDCYAFGYKALADGRGSYAIGYNARALGQDAYSIGTGTEASAEGSFAIGFVGRDSSGVTTGNTKAIAPWAMAFGMGSQSTQQGAIAIGTKCEAQGGFSTAMGLNSITNAWNATAIGNNARANGESSVSIGHRTITDGTASVSLGNGSYAMGFASVAIGHETQSTGYISTAMGWGSVASGNGATAIGSFCISSGSTTFSAGGGSIADNDWSLALGHDCLSSGVSSVAMGEISAATGDGAVAIGWATNASGDYSFAAGNNSIATGHSAVAIGGYTEAIGGGSLAVNGNNKSIGGSSFAAGDQTQAMGTLSASFGYYTKAKPFASMVIGQYNDTTCLSTTIWDNGDPAFIIGNGTDEFTRSNAFTVLKNGRTAIGHADPSQTLDVNGNARFRNIESGAYFSVLNITTDGTLTVSSSDVSLKDHVRPITNSLCKILALQGVEFSWKNDPESLNHIGFVAQEMESVIPELVFTNPADGLKGINYSELTAVLAEAIKEQQAIIEKLEARIAILESRNE